MATETKARLFSDLAIPPGELLAEELEARGMTQKELADRTGRPEQKISEIINGKKSITHDTALELEKVLGVSADFWVNLEASYQLTRARLRERIQLEKDEDWLSFFPIGELRKRGCITKERANEAVLASLLRFFGVASFVALRQRAVLHNYRITPGSAVSEGALWAWLRCGSIAAKDMDLGPYDEKRFRAALPAIRGITKQPLETACAEAQRLCAAAGVALVVEKEFPKSGANGVARWLRPDRPLIQLSTKRRFQDIFWFTFFHEAHQILKGQKRRTYITWKEPHSDDVDEEAAADGFAQDAIIPRREWQSFVRTRPRSAAAVVAFAASQGIDPGLVVGRLQNDKVILHSHLNGLRRRIKWSSDDD
jgi:addiction module HigA family antidote